jgi:hypothetical protein
MSNMSNETLQNNSPTGFVMKVCQSDLLKDKGVRCEIFMMATVRVAVFCQVSVAPAALRFRLAV